MKSEAEMLREALEKIVAIGHNDDCLFCGFKDKQAIAALADPPAIAKETPLAPDGRIDLDKGVDQGVIEVHGLKPATPLAPKRWRCSEGHEWSDHIPICPNCGERVRPVVESND